MTDTKTEQEIIDDIAASARSIIASHATRPHPMIDIAEKTLAALAALDANTQEDRETKELGTPGVVDPAVRSGE